MGFWRELMESIEEKYQKVSIVYILHRNRNNRKSQTFNIILPLLFSYIQLNQQTIVKTIITFPLREWERPDGKNQGSTYGISLDFTTSPYASPFI